MPRINPANPETIDSKSAGTLRAVNKKLGGLPNIFTTFAQSPAALNGYVQLAESLAGGRLSAKQRELIALTVAQENACQYCLSAHTVMGKGVGLSPDEIKQARIGNATQTMDRLITQFALKLVRSKAEISEEEFSTVVHSGLDEGLVVEIIANVALNLMTNYLNKVADTEIDFPVVDLKSAA
jgi:uncharacterized peroxidase-related enzyme